jgi:hypothetical protein
MPQADQIRQGCQPSDTDPLWKLVDELIFKGALFLGAGLGLAVALRIFGGKPSNGSK